MGGGVESKAPQQKREIEGKAPNGRVGRKTNVKKGGGVTREQGANPHRVGWVGKRAAKNREGWGQCHRELALRK